MGSQYITPGDVVIARAPVIAVGEEAEEEEESYSSTTRKWNAAVAVREKVKCM